MKTFLKIKTISKTTFLVFIMCFSTVQFSFANGQKDTVVVLQKRGKDRRYLKSCVGTNVLMVCAFKKHGLTVLSEKVGVEFHADLYNRRFSEGASLLTFLLNIKPPKKEEEYDHNPYGFRN